MINLDKLNKKATRLAEMLIDFPTVSSAVVTEGSATTDEIHHNPFITINNFAYVDVLQDKYTVTTPDGSCEFTNKKELAVKLDSYLEEYYLQQRG